MKSMMMVCFGMLLMQLNVCTAGAKGKAKAPAKEPVARKEASVGRALPAPAKHKWKKGLARATFAGGCFWCMQPPFDKLKGVISTSVGYTGGVRKNPTYKQVAYGLTKHAEAIEVIYDPKQVSYARLLEVFWMNIDPTAKDRQFVDAGTQYRSGIFVHNEAQRKLALRSKQLIASSGRFKKPIVTPIVKAGPFYHAEAYHQSFYKKSPLHYYRYRRGSGRDQFIQKYWAKNPLRIELTKKKK